MTKRITAFILSFVMVLLLLPAVSVPVSAIPSSGNVVQQMGGPVSSKFSLNIDDIIKNYASSKAYEARFYPFGEGEGMPVFIGTAHRVKDINKTDAEIASLDAMEKAGTDEYSLKQFLNYVKKYEATCQTSAEVLQETIYDVAKTALSAAGFVAGDLYGDAGETIGNVVGAASFATGAVDTTGSLTQNGVNVDVIASIGFTLGDLAGLAGGVFSIGVLTTIGTVAAVGGVGYTMFQKYMEHQEQWKDFANYLMGRRNLVEFFKYLNAELTEAMENTSGWDIQFNQSEYEGEQGCVFWDIPITYNLQARFMHGYVSEFEFGQVNNTNEDGWSGSIELNMKANMEKFQEGWRNCTHSVLQDAQIEAMNQMASSPGGSVTENDYQIIEPLYWNGNLTCLNFPLKADSMDEEQPQIVFTGSLASGSYTYDQGGEMSGVYAVKYGLQNIYTWRNTDRVKIDRDGLTHSFTVYTHSTSYGVLRDGGDTVLIEHGDLFIYELIIQRSEAKMIIDLTKPLGYATN